MIALFVAAALDGAETSALPADLKLDLTCEGKAVYAILKPQTEYGETSVHNPARPTTDTVRRSSRLSVWFHVTDGKARIVLPRKLIPPDQDGQAPNRRLKDVQVDEAHIEGLYSLAPGEWAKLTLDRATNWLEVDGGREHRFSGACKPTPVPASQ